MVGFDALGGVSAIFYMTDDDVITTINVKESRSLTAALKDARAQRLFYVESIKSDVYPVGDLPVEKHRLKDFKWRGDERPVSREDITTRIVRSSERREYTDERRPLYPETNKFFDNYIFDLFEEIEAGKRAEQERRKAEQDSIAREETLKRLEDERLAAEAEAATDSVAAVDSLVPEHPPVAEDVPVAKDSSVVVAPPAEKIDKDKVRKVEEPVESVASQETVTRSEELGKAEKRALKRAEREARREARRAARAARKAEREARRLARKAAREATRLEKKRIKETINETD